MKKELIQYGELLNAVKSRIRQAQTKAILSANAEMILLYWDIGRMIDQRQQEEGWGAGVIPRLSRDVRNNLPEIKGFSERNLKRMIRFYREYPFIYPEVPRPVAQFDMQDRNEKVPQAVAQLKTATYEHKAEIRELILNLPWGQNFLLIEKLKEMPVRIWYMHMTIEKGWSRNVLQLMIESNAYERQGTAITNFETHLPSPQSDLAKQALKDPYIFDFLTLDEPFRERELENSQRSNGDLTPFFMWLLNELKGCETFHALNKGKHHGMDKKDLQNLAPDSCPSHLPGPCRM